MAHAYTIAISRLEGLLGKSMQVVTYEKMLPQAKERSLAALGVGEEFLSVLLKCPTHAWKHFHKGADLLRDWDTFNMKKAALMLKQGEADHLSEEEVIPERKLSRTRKAGNDLSPSPTTPSPKKKKMPAPSIEVSSPDLSEDFVRNPSCSNSGTDNHLWEMQAAHKEQERLRELLEKAIEKEDVLKKRVTTLECEASASERIASVLKVSCCAFLGKLPIFQQLQSEKCVCISQTSVKSTRYIVFDRI